MSKAVALIGNAPARPLFDDVTAVDVYDLPQTDLAGFSGVYVSQFVDQRALATQHDQLSEFVRAGGRMLFCGHPVLDVVEGIPKYRKMSFRNVADIELSTVNPHPMWEGVDIKDAFYRTGVPGQHSFEQLRKIGVAGFYSRAYLVNLPDQATTITGIGPYQLPVDVSYPLGNGEVIVHNGLDLVIFNEPGTTIAGWPRRIFDYLAGVEPGGNHG
ncbi:hypothetical protein [Corynebacterium cystitidis]|uniref:hypothetical protein n=1 Tax=Corynebacterium cystitidis TaxID=35757 RepID=UPI00211E6B3C|nr:hypothetical protein [Corynebacterium cystitidis]